MSKPVRLVREARDELHEAARRYGEVRPELRAEFLVAIDEAMAQLFGGGIRRIQSRRDSDPPWRRTLSAATAG